MTIVAFLTGTITEARRPFPTKRSFLLGNLLGIAIGTAAVILGRRAWPRFLWWLFSRGDT